MVSGQRVCRLGLRRAGLTNDGFQRVERNKAGATTAPATFATAGPGLAFTPGYCWRARARADHADVRPRWRRRRAQRRVDKARAERRNESMRARGSAVAAVRNDLSEMSAV